MSARDRNALHRQLQDEIRALERQMRAGEQLTDSAWSRLDELALACAPLPPRLQGRLAALRRQVALQSRRVPAGVLDDLVHSVRVQVAHESDDPAQYWRRAGLSNSFLDAPQQLVVWRRMAVAALLLVGVGAGALLSGTLTVGSRPEAAVAGTVHDPRNDLLPPDVPRRSARRARPMFPVRTVGDGTGRLPVGGANSTVVFPMRDLSSPNVSDMLDGLAIPDIGSVRLIEDN